MEGYLHDRLQIEYDQWPSSTVLQSWQKRKRAKSFYFFQQVFVALSWMKNSSVRLFAVAFPSGKAWWIRVEDITPQLTVPLMKSNFYKHFFMNVTAETERSSHLSLLTDSTNVKKTSPPPPEPFWTNVRNTSEQCSIWNRGTPPPHPLTPHVNVSVMNAANRRCIILFPLHLFLNIKWMW